ncbi:hypothetical protein B9Z55_003879 [Caenorhabditis nigoni]|uniref:Uncharacterized protein n=1 Tax=Caenorhabditis nigoni TaxID=1611254 RepID=A0A2G5VSJ8_9PELO|nr:hypothetical protein B9Z55_003873 [Caenorhabditis nigoni]PIC54759.1 hypothetical protein B9Z55_003879 [Caenorhabditis nigoni]
MELRLHHRESTVTQYTKETPLDVPSCPQESASLTSAHSLAHEELRSTECSTGLAPKEEHQPPMRSRHTLSNIYALSPSFLCVSRIPDHPSFVIIIPISLPTCSHAGRLLPSLAPSCTYSLTCTCPAGSYWPSLYSNKPIVIQSSCYFTLTTSAA